MAVQTICRRLYQKGCLPHRIAGRPIGRHRFARLMLCQITADRQTRTHSLPLRCCQPWHQLAASPLIACGVLPSRSSSPSARPDKRFPLYRGADGRQDRRGPDPTITVAQRPPAIAPPMDTEPRTGGGLVSHRFYPHLIRTVIFPRASYSLSPAWSFRSNGLDVARSVAVTRGGFRPVFKSRRRQRKIRLAYDPERHLRSLRRQSRTAGSHSR